MVKVIGIALSLLAWQVNASLVIDVYCTSKTCNDFRTQSQRLKGVSVGVHEIDANVTISKKWSDAMKAALPKSEEEGVKFLSDLMNTQEGRTDMQKMTDSAKAIERVVLSGIEKIPAFVCHENYVVYGGSLYQAVKSCSEIEGGR